MRRHNNLPPWPAAARLWFLRGWRPSSRSSSWSDFPLQSHFSCSPIWRCRAGRAGPCRSRSLPQPGDFSTCVRAPATFPVRSWSVTSRRRSMRTKQLLAALALALAIPVAWAQGSFYEGKTVTVVIGASGGSLEIAARIVARHLAKHLPGNPNVIVQNMTGAAHLVATNHVYTVAKPDEIGRASCRERV